MHPSMNSRVLKLLRKTKYLTSLNTLALLTNFIKMLTICLQFRLLCKRINKVNPKDIISLYMTDSYRDRSSQWSHLHKMNTKWSNMINSACQQVKTAL